MMRMSLYPERVRAYEVAKHLGASVPVNELIDVVKRYFTDDRINWNHEKQRRAVEEEYGRAWTKWSSIAEVERALQMTDDIQFFLRAQSHKVFDKAVLAIVERYGG